MLKDLPLLFHNSKRQSVDRTLLLSELDLSFLVQDTAYSRYQWPEMN